MNEVEQLKLLFRNMRDAWFKCHLQIGPCEREWETEEHKRSREHSNDTRRVMFDKQTEAIIEGKTFNLTPLCGADIWKDKEDNNW